MGSIGLERSGELDDWSVHDEHRYRFFCLRPPQSLVMLQEMETCNDLQGGSNGLSASSLSFVTLQLPFLHCHTIPSSSLSSLQVEHRHGVTAIQSLTKHESLPDR